MARERNLKPCTCKNGEFSTSQGLLQTNSEPTLTGLPAETETVMQSDGRRDLVNSRSKGSVASAKSFSSQLSAVPRRSGSVPGAHLPHAKAPCARRQTPGGTAIRG